MAFAESMADASDAGDKLTIVTGNDKKWREMVAILGEGRLVRSAIDLPEMQGASVSDVARAKCVAAAEMLGATGPVIVEDTGLSFSALGGRLPGPFIKWFLGDLGAEGLARMLHGQADRSATAECALAMWPGPLAASVPPRSEDVVVFLGTVPGSIADAPRSGSNEPFGWDPIFVPFEQPMTGGPLTYAEMTPQVKNGLSHRRKALDALCSHLKI